MRESPKLAHPRDWRLTDDVIARGLRRVNWPGRWERITVGGQALILDAAHNSEGAQALDGNLARLRGCAPGDGTLGAFSNYFVASHQEASPGQNLRLRGRKRAQRDAGDSDKVRDEACDEPSKLIIVIGALGAQRARALLEVVARHARELHLVVPRQARACSHEELEALVPKSFRGAIHRASVGKLFPMANRCVLLDNNAPIIVTGSICLLGEVLVCLQPQVKDEGRLQDF
jgi:dihydrofolate synthase/folylpolyglutamate synthase